jgi:hypothetical protein
MPQEAKGTRLSVLGGELPLDVGGPQVVGDRGHRGHDARMLVGPAPAALLHEALAGEQVPHGTDGWPRRRRDLAMAWGAPLEHLPRSPVWMRSAGLAQALGEVALDAVRALVRSVAPVPKAPAAFLVVAGQPSVAGLPTDAVAGTQLRSRVQAAPIVGDKAFALHHGRRLQPGHVQTFPSTGWTCSLSRVSPIIPV